MWDASADIDSPICVSAESPYFSFSINIFEDEDGVVRGLCVYGDEGVLLGAYGELPVEVIEDERAALGLEPLGLSKFLPVTALEENASA